MAIASSLLQAIKNVASLSMRFSSIPESFIKKIKIDKDIQCLLKVTTSTEYKKYMVEAMINQACGNDIRAGV